MILTILTAFNGLLLAGLMIACLIQLCLLRRDLVRPAPERREQPPTELESDLDKIMSYTGARNAR